MLHCTTSCRSRGEDFQRRPYHPPVLFVCLSQLTATREGSNNPLRVASSILSPGRARWLACGPYISVGLQGDRNVRVVSGVKGARWKGGRDGTLEDDGHCNCATPRSRSRRGTRTRLEFDAATVEHIFAVRLNILGMTARAVRHACCLSELKTSNETNFKNERNTARGHVYSD